jgi:hypothetical protein
VPPSDPLLLDPLPPVPLPPDPLDAPLPLVDAPLVAAVPALAPLEIPVPEPAPVEAPLVELAPVELEPPELMPLLWLVPPVLLEHADAIAEAAIKPIVSRVRILFSLSTYAEPGQFADAFARVRLNCAAVC